MRNGEIVFVRHTGPKVDGLHVVETDGTGPRPLGSLPVRCSSPAWSPDGSRLVVVAHSDEDSAMFLGELHAINADGSGLSRIIRDHSLKLRPAWSPDGAEVVFERSVGTSGYHLFAVRADGAGLRQITGPEVPEAAPPRSLGKMRGWTSYMSPAGAAEQLPVSEEMPAWSPDGRIAFVRTVPVEPREPGDVPFARWIGDYEPAWRPLP